MDDTRFLILSLRIDVSTSEIVAGNGGNDWIEKEADASTSAL
jgi:hypothetical protein